MGAKIVNHAEGRFALEGEMNFTSVPVLHEQSRGLFAGVSRLEFDLGGVTRSDSAALSLMLEWQRDAQRNGQQIHFNNVPEQLRVIARLYGIDKDLPITDE